jgi:hypothetical protein
MLTHAAGGLCRVPQARYRHVPVSLPGMQDRTPLRHLATADGACCFTGYLSASSWYPRTRVCKGSSACGMCERHAGSPSAQRRRSPSAQRRWSPSAQRRWSPSAQRRRSPSPRHGGHPGIRRDASFDAVLVLERDVHMWMITHGL